jgi:aarF domain-containing kinase
VKRAENITETQQISIFWSQRVSSPIVQYPKPQIIIMLILIGSFVLLLQCTPASTALATATGAMHTWMIPEHLRVSDDELRDFSAISSHGRDDDLDDNSSSSVRTSSFALVVRSIYLFILFLPVILTAIPAYLWSAFRNFIWFSLLTKSMAGGGAAFIKWGQWASTRPDLFPEELCVILSHLHTNAPQHSYSFTKNQIEKEFGDKIDKIFESFQRKPIASGSIAQVYKAWLNGRKVAVKVRHPGVEEQIKLDFIIMKFIAKLIESSPGLSWINLSESLSQFSHTIASQTDLSVEGKHLYLFNSNFRSWKSVSFPVPIVLSNSVLIESWEEGTTISEYTAMYNSNKVMNMATYEKFLATTNTDTTVTLVKEGDLPVTLISPSLAFFIVSKGVDVYMKMLLTDNLMHSDLHPGNIFVQQLDSSGLIIPPADHLTHRDRYSAVNRIVLVDAGMVARLVPEEQENFIGILQAMGNGRGDHAADCVLKFSRRTDYTESQKLHFKEDMVVLFGKVCKGYHHNVQIGTVLKGILNLVRIHQVTIEANYATLVMNALCLESLATNLMPSYNILDGAKQMLQFHGATKKFVGVGVFKRLVPLAQAIKNLKDFFFVRGLKKTSS